MSYEGFLKVKTCALKVYIHCEDCKKKIRKILQKIDGVYTIKIEAELRRVIVSGDVEPEVLIKELKKHKKYAELIPSDPKGNNEQGQLGNSTNPPIFAGGNLPPTMPTLAQMKALEELTKLPPPPQLAALVNAGAVKGPNQNSDPKTVKFDLPAEKDDEMVDVPPEMRMKHPPPPMGGNGGSATEAQIPRMIPGINPGHQQLMRGANGGGNGGCLPVNGGSSGGYPGALGSAIIGGGGNGGFPGVGKNTNICGGVRNIPVQMNMGENSNGGHLNQGGVPNAGAAGVGPGVSVAAGDGGIPMMPMNIPAMKAAGGGQMGPLGGGGIQMGPICGLMGPIPPAQGPPTPAQFSQQQQMAAMMMSQQEAAAAAAAANANDKFQSMLNGMPPSDTTYFPPYPNNPYQPFPPPPRTPTNPYDYYSFSDDNAGSCAVM